MALNISGMHANAFNRMQAHMGEWNMGVDKCERMQVVSSFRKDILDVLSMWEIKFRGCRSLEWIKGCEIRFAR